MKGRRSFADSEAAEIGELLDQLEEARRQGDAAVAKKLREKNMYDFYITNFDTSGKGFDRSDFEGLIRTGRIAVAGR
ncbi:MAG: hypothetical protein OXC26_17580 [Albidovulum sp.]|nr:hypothetical protein [Albidovulum sp.]